MKNFILKIRRFIYRIKRDYFSFDNIILLIAVAACAIFTVASIAAMARNWELAQTISARKKELALLQLEVETLELENDYYSSEEYQELAARRQQGKKLAGENVVYLPENSTAAKTKHSDTTTAASTTPSNISQWISFLFGV